MKKNLTLTIVLFLASFSPTLAQERTDDIIVNINGMVCDFCAQSLKKVFGKEDNVNGIAVSLDDQTVTVDTKNGTDLTDEKIKELIEWGGYELIEIKRP